MESPAWMTTEITPDAHENIRFIHPAQVIS
jgi:hypothetical protein